MTKMHKPGAILAIGRGGRETTLCTLTKSNFLTEMLLFYYTNQFNAMI